MKNPKSRSLRGLLWLLFWPGAIIGVMGLVYTGGTMLEALIGDASGDSLEAGVRMFAVGALMAAPAVRTGMIYDLRTFDREH